jgi:hypothetical protein
MTVERILSNSIRGWTARRVESLEAHLFKKVAEKNRMPEPDRQITVFLSFEPDLQVGAERINQWPISNADFASYNRRVEAACDGAAAEESREMVRCQILAADVLVCFIASMHPDPWILWELEIAKAAGKGLIGILMKDYLDPPEPMRNCGAAFIPFKKDKLETAISFAASSERDMTEDYLLEDE